MQIWTNGTLLHAVNDHLSKIGAIGFLGSPLGWSRLAFSAEESRAHDYAAQAMKAAGFAIRVDRFGNLFGTKPGSRGGPPLLIGTHLDTVPNGGNYDGVVGFIVALESVRLAERRGPLPVPVEIVIFRGEESTRFKKACLGSRAAFGFLAPQEVRDLHFTDGVGTLTTLADAMSSCGFDPKSVGTEFLAPNDYRGYFETHIEQARVLEGLNALGIVTSIRAPERRRVTVTGVRAVKASCAMILAVEWTCRLHASMGVDVVGTVGKVSGFFHDADKISAVPGAVRFNLGPLGKADHRVISAVAKANDVTVAFDDAPHGAMVHVAGITDHSGGTPMGKAFRRDALTASAEMLLALDDATIGDGHRRVDFYLDLRSVRAGDRSRISAEIVRAFNDIARGFGVEAAVYEPTEATDPVERLDRRLQAKLRRAAARLGIDTVDLPSGAGHDALFTAQAGIPTAMLFVKSVDGLSHNPKEFTPSEDIAMAVAVQAEVITSWDDEVGDGPS